MKKEISNIFLEQFCESFKLEILIKEQKCFKYAENIIIWLLDLTYPISINWILLSLQEIFKMPNVDHNLVDKDEFRDELLRK